MNRAGTPYSYIANPSKGAPLFNSSLYFGIPDLDPEIPANQIQVYLQQEDGSVIPVSQPVQTGSGGVPMYNGSPAIILIDQDTYSFKALNNLGAQIYYQENSEATLAPSSTVGIVDNYADVRALNGTSFAVISVSGISSDGDGGYGVFYADAADVVSSDDGGTILVDASGMRWKRLYSGSVHIDWFEGGIDSALLVSNQIAGTAGKTYTAGTFPQFANAIVSGECVVSVPEGIHTLATTASIGWADQLSLIGAAPESLTYSSLGGITGAAGAWSIPINVASEGGATVGMFLRLSAVTGTGTPEAILGCWPITAVGTGVITITHTAQNAAFPTLTVATLTITLIKSVVVSDGETTVQHYGGNTLSDNIVYRVINATPADGTKGWATAPRANAADSNYANASAQFGSNTGFYGAGNHGVVVGGTGWIEFKAGACACGNDQDGFHATEGGGGFGKFIIAVGNGESGVMSEMNADFEADGIKSLCNGDHGAESIAGKLGLAQATTLLSYNLKRGIQAQDGAIVRAASAVCSYNAVGMRAEYGAKILAPSSTCDNNTSEGYLAVKDAFIDAESSTSSNNSIGYSSQRLSYITAIGNTASGNANNYNLEQDGDIEITSGWVSGWRDFPTPPAFNGVTVSNYNTQEGKYKIKGNTCYWRIKLDYSGLDTADVSQVVIGDLPFVATGDNGECQLQLLGSTGITMAATDTYQATYNTLDRVLFYNSARSAMQYNSGKIAAAGVVMLAGWFQFNGSYTGA